MDTKPVFDTESLEESLPEISTELKEVSVALPETVTQLEKTQEELEAEEKKRAALSKMMEYLQRFHNAELSFPEYQKLSRGMKARYRQVMRASGKTHINGRPLADFEVVARAKKKVAAKKARKAARASRQRNRRAK